MHNIKKIELKKSKLSKTLVAAPRKVITKYVIDCKECGLYKSFSKKKEATDFLKQNKDTCL